MRRSFALSRGPPPQAIWSCSFLGRRSVQRNTDRHIASGEPPFNERGPLVAELRERSDRCVVNHQNLERLLFQRFQYLDQLPWDLLPFAK